MIKNIKDSNLTYNLHHNVNIDKLRILKKNRIMEFVMSHIYVKSVAKNGRTIDKVKMRVQ